MFGPSAREALRLLYDRLGEPCVMIHDSHHPGRLVGRDGVLADGYRLLEP